MLGDIGTSNLMIVYNMLLCGNQIGRVGRAPHDKEVCESVGGSILLIEFTVPPYLSLRKAHWSGMVMAPKRAATLWQRGGRMSLYI
jgi:hypothetical protein